MYTTSGNYCNLTSPENSIVCSSAAVLSLPFDIAREAYALAVKTGLIQDSLIACARYSRDLVATEKMTLGRWARSC